MKWHGDDEEARVYLHPLTNYPSTRDECWYVNAADIHYNLVDSGEAVELEWNSDVKDYEVK